MKRILLAAAALAAIGAAAVTPASAQVWIGATPDYGAGVQVGPFGVGVGPDYWGYHHRYWRDYAYAGPQCRSVRERIVTPSGHVIWRVHRDCD